MKKKICFKVEIDTSFHDDGMTAKEKEQAVKFLKKTIKDAVKFGCDFMDLDVTEEATTGPVKVKVTDAQFYD